MEWLGVGDLWNLINSDAFVQNHTCTHHYPFYRSVMILSFTDEDMYMYVYWKDVWYISCCILQRDTYYSLESILLVVQSCPARSKYTVFISFPLSLKRHNFVVLRSMTMIYGSFKIEFNRPLHEKIVRLITVPSLLLSLLKMLQICQWITVREHFHASPNYV
jgi:hypothetical protein